MFGCPYTYWPGSGVRWLINRWLFSNIYLPNPRIIKPLLCERDMRTWAALNLVPLEFPVKELAKSSAGRQRPIPGINAESFFLFFADDDNRRPVGHLHNKIAAIHSRRNDLNLNFAKKALFLYLYTVATTSTPPRCRGQRTLTLFCYLNTFALQFSSRPTNQPTSPLQPHIQKQPGRLGHNTLLTPQPPE